MSHQNSGPILSKHFFLIAPEQQDRRLDALLGTLVEGISRSRLQKLIREGAILVNGTRVKPSYLTRTGDTIAVTITAPAEERALDPERMPLDILHEDEDLIVINKPPGLVVHPGAGHSTGTLVHGLLAHSPKLAVQGSPLRPGIVHRLDKDTSGALVIAKSETAYLDLVKQFSERDVHKEYLALVYGTPSQAGGEISGRLGRHPTDRKRIAVLQTGGKEAITRWKIETTWGGTSLLRVLIATGRTHQIRVHLSAIRHPVVGDETYGGGRSRARSIQDGRVQKILLGAGRQMLHAAYLEFTHPAQRRRIQVTAPLPLDFKRIIEELDDQVEK